MPMADQDSEQLRKLSLGIAKVFHEIQTSNATHIRKLKELAALLSSSSPIQFCNAFCKSLGPLFDFQSRIAVAERIIKFVSVFACSCAGKEDCGVVFLDNFLRFLLLAAAAANKTVRFRACQIVSEIIMRLPDDAEVSSELWDEVIECMKLRMEDKTPATRTFAVRALARFATDSENEDILELFIEKLQLEQNGDVRKAIVLAMPPSSATLSAIIDFTLDVNESVRKAAYFVLASKFPLQSLSIKQRTDILQRGLADRSTAVAKECMKLIKDEWLEKSCNGDPIQLLKFLDVETYESVGELVMTTLLKAGLVKLQNDQSIRKFFSSTGESAEGPCNKPMELMDAEVVLFWRMVCKHLHEKAHTKGSDAAMTTGAESAVYAAEASDSNDLLDNILPASLLEYVKLVNAHIAAGPNYRFVSRQLLLLGTMLDFSDASNRKVASEFVQKLLHMTVDHEFDDQGNEVVVGDGFNLGGERDWAAAVAELVKKVHAVPGEFEEVVLGVVEELARPCRERTADYKEWLHCLAVVSLLLEKTSSFRHMRGKPIEPTEILLSILLPGAKHANLDVQRASLGCLGLFSFLERAPSETIVKQLRSSFVYGPPSISVMASKALLDLAVWHGPDEMDKAMNCNLSSLLSDHNMAATKVEFCSGTEDPNIELLSLLYAGLGHNWGGCVATEENQPIQEILGEGLAKILLLSEKFPGSLASMHHLLLAKLIILYFGSDSEHLQRLKQCLSVFFEHYPSLSANHKICLSKAFMPVVRSLWPGINGNAAGSSMMVSKMRKRAILASQFMVQMMQAPPPPLLDEAKDKESEKADAEKDDPLLDFQSGEEGLALRIAAEVVSLALPGKKSAAEKSYAAALCRALSLLNFRVSEQAAIKLMRMLLSRMIISVAASEKDVARELKHMRERLQGMEKQPDEKLSADQMHRMLGTLMLDHHLSMEEDMDEAAAANTHTPVVVPSTTWRTNAARKQQQARRSEEESSSDDEISPPINGVNVVPNTPARSQRASKTAALTRMTATVRIDEDDDEDDDGDVTSEDES
ncbi:uncharacterized protein LOC127260232 [Andrographis paniculata]|uniref:uncharacterized protein LOC127260232 n=1 Tax=Andrographis paniculata TaxID=175694 RepID=UPI0021E721EB|nr:uncharacterized protein LOC127260232 [Andrographis paniculata]